MAHATGATYSDSDNLPLRNLLERMFMPLARLCLAKGIRFDTAQEQLKRSFIIEAQALHPEQPEHGLISRVAAATGLNRRETTRLLRAAPARRSQKIPLAAQVIARWGTDRQYTAADGTPLLLPRLGEPPSFEALARGITSNLHPRTVLDELLRLAVVHHDQEKDQVQLLQAEYIPGSDQPEMLALLAGNVGDHLESAVANVMQDDIKHHDQAVFADELSEESVKELAPLIRQQWQRLKESLIPAITTLLEQDRQAGRKGSRRLRVGLYSYNEPWSEKQEDADHENQN